MKLITTISLHTEIEKLVRTGVDDVHVVMVIDGREYQVDIVPMPEQSSDEERLNVSSCICGIEEPSSLLQSISRLAFVLRTGREDARRGNRWREAVFDCLVEKCIKVHTEALIQSRIMPTEGR